VRPAAGIDAIYFVSRNDRTHEFNENLREHERAVGRYQRGDGRPDPASPRSGAAR
jgi:cell division protein YceG involved in septum cleavage